MTEDQSKIEIVEEKILTNSESKPLFTDIIKNSAKSLNKDTLPKEQEVLSKEQIKQPPSKQPFIGQKIFKAPFKTNNEQTIKEELIKDITDDNKKQSMLSRKNVITIAIIIVISITIIAIIGCLYYIIIVKKHKEEVLVLTTDIDNYKKELTKKQTEQQSLVTTFQDEKKRLEDQIIEMDHVIKDQQMELMRVTENFKQMEQKQPQPSQQHKPPQKQQTKPRVKFVEQHNDDSDDGLEEFKQPQSKQPKQKPQPQIKQQIKQSQKKQPQIEMENNEYMIEHQEFTDAPIVEKEKKLTPAQLTKKLINGKSKTSLNNKLLAIQQQEEAEEQQAINYDKEQQQISKELGLSKNIVNEDKLRDAVAKMENVVDEQINDQHKEEHEQEYDYEEDSDNIGLGIDDKIDESLIATN